ncbi:Tn3 family transposase [Methylocaldum sp. RMAD-M]|uniref:Tn3 family transposase n=1 Tax=Methylocaldum sp. RMAD-M TaxID=2806557 RepID=UPI001B579A33|nr:hypothetical protein [Methylocaldum sp. RMAD-M]
MTDAAKGHRFLPDTSGSGGILQGHRIGYVRVSSFDQNPERQLEHVQVHKVFTDKASGKDTQRPQLDALPTFVREGDTVVVHSMDRLARNLDDLRHIVQKLTKRGVRIEFVKENLTFTGEDSPMANLMLWKLGSYPRQNGLAVALRELGRIERTLFALDWMQNVELRRRVQIGLNKGEAKNALARAVFLNRLGEIRDRSFENQRYRASGLNLVVAAIVLWNTVYLERAVQALRDSGKNIDERLLPHLSPLGWEHINLTGDYIWRQNKQVEQGKFRPLRVPGEA